MKQLQMNQGCGISVKKLRQRDFLTTELAKPSPLNSCSVRHSHLRFIHFDHDVPIHALLQKIESTKDTLIGDRRFANSVLDTLPT
jgi:hypothetical protein